jgi:hypothetical protein
MSKIFKKLDQAIASQKMSQKRDGRKKAKRVEQEAARRAEFAREFPNYGVANQKKRRIDKSVSGD